MEWKCDRTDHKSGWNTIPPSTSSTNPIMPFAWRLLTLILCGYCFIRAVTNRVLFNCKSLDENRTLEARRGIYTPSVWNPKPDDSIRECNQLCNSVRRSLHGWRVVFWFVWMLWQIVLFNAAHVEEHEESSIEGGDQREGVVQHTHPVLQSSPCDDSLQG